MFNIFRRSRPSELAVATPPQPEQPALAPPGQHPVLDGTMPLPEVVEGNGDADWGMWELAVSGEGTPSQFEKTWPGRPPYQQGP